nr:NUDIX domain-containing protein [Actinomycetota bacterium]
MGRDETAEQACVREVREETGLEVRVLAFIAYYHHPDRDPRRQNVALAFLVEPTGGELRAGDDADDAHLVVLYRELARTTLRKRQRTVRLRRGPVKLKTVKPTSGTTSGTTGTTSGTTGTTSGTTTTTTTTTTTAPKPNPGVSGSCAFGTFKVGSWPGGCWRPYSDSSPFNRPIPVGAPSHPNSDAIVRRTLSFGPLGHLLAGDADTSEDWNHPTYYSQPDDPIFTLHCYEDWGECDIEGHQIRIPDAARPAAGGDGHLTVVDQASGWEYDLYKVRSKPAGGGTLEFRWGGRTRIDGDGLGSDATAARFGNLAGIIRAQEMDTARIAHALFMNARCDSGTYVYPAKKNGRACSAIGESNSDAPPMGARFQLAMSPEQIEALAVPRWKKTILHAMAEYGMYMGDTGGDWGVSFESGSTYTSFGVEDEMVRFARENGVPFNNGHYVFNLREGVDWGRYLRVVDPCVAQATC